MDRISALKKAFETGYTTGLEEARTQKWNEKFILDLAEQVEDNYNPVEKTEAGPVNETLVQLPGINVEPLTPEQIARIIKSLIIQRRQDQDVDYHNFDELLTSFSSLKEYELTIKLRENLKEYGYGQFDVIMKNDYYK